jgi:hypothetical protein
MDESRLEEWHRIWAIQTTEQTVSDDILKKISQIMLDEIEGPQQYSEVVGSDKVIVTIDDKEYAVRLV